MVVLKNARPIRNDAGEVSGAVAAFTDISALKELQPELDQRRREAEEISIRKTHFLAAVSHDIRTPANAINLIAELIGRTWAVPAMAAEIPQLTRELKDSASALVELLNDVLDIARYDSGKIELQIGPFDVSELAREQVQNLRRLATDKGLSLEFAAAASPGSTLADSDHRLMIAADRMKLARVLANLVGNAIKFTEHGGIIVRAEDAGDAIAISVSDTGIGIPPEMLTHIFEEFVQLRTPSADRNKGTGLGLSICRRLVSAMGGNFPCTAPSGRAARSPSPSPRTPRPPPRHLRSRHAEVSRRWRVLRRPGPLLGRPCRAGKSFPKSKPSSTPPGAMCSAVPALNFMTAPSPGSNASSTAAISSHLQLSQTSYRIFVGTNLYHPELADRFGPEVMANPVGVSTGLQTADGKLFFGVRNVSVAYYPRRTHPFAGSLEPRDNCEIFSAARRELREELALADSDLGSLKLLGLVEDRLIRHPELIFSATTRLAERQLIAQMDQAEHHDTVAIPAGRAGVESALGTVLYARGDCMPAVMGEIALWR